MSRYRRGRDERLAVRHELAGTCGQRQALLEILVADLQTLRELLEQLQRLRTRDRR
jgi:hypothetical protein